MGITMVIYFSSAIPYIRFNEYLNNGIIKGGHQAQKFNDLILGGIVKHTEVVAISNPPYSTDNPLRQENTEADGIRYRIARKSFGTAGAQIRKPVFFVSYGLMRVSIQIGRSRDFRRVSISARRLQLCGLQKNLRFPRLQS